jgi:hypothetical protein
VNSLAVAAESQAAVGRHQRISECGRVNVPDPAIQKSQKPVAYSTVPTRLELPKPGSCTFGHVANHEALTTLFADYPFISWNSLEISTGQSILDRAVGSPIPLDWLPTGIRNCSYAPERDQIGITGGDRERDTHALVIADRQTGATASRFDFAYILHHALDDSGQIVCLIRPSTYPGTADVLTLEVSTGKTEVLVVGGAHQATIPAWSPGNEQIAYHSPDKQVCVVDREGVVRTIRGGEFPAVSPNGQKIATRDNNSIAVSSLDAIESTTALRPRPPVVDGPSWSPDGGCLLYGITSGLVGKLVKFKLLELATGRTRSSPITHQSGARLIALTAEGRPK